MNFQTWRIFQLFFVFKREYYLLALSLPIFYHWLAKLIILLQKSDLYETKMYSEQGSRQR